MVLQAAMKDLPLHWAVKFPVQLIVALAILFATYHWLVRFTFIGAVLNGIKHRRAARSEDGARHITRAASLSAPLAELIDVRKRFGKVTALDGLSLDVRAGELLAVLGPNGAGKSTAISLLLGLQQAESGTATCSAAHPTTSKPADGVGVMMQEVTLAVEMTPRELIALTTAYYPAPMTADEAMALTHIGELADRPYGKLSAGQKRQVQFALAVCGRPSLLFLDEPTVGLDVQARETLWTTIRGAAGAGRVDRAHDALSRRSRSAGQPRRRARPGPARRPRHCGRHPRRSSAASASRCRSALCADDVAGWANVTAATNDHGRLQIVARDADDVVRRLLTADATLCDLEVQRAGLAEAFNEITQEAA